ncbi:MAG TPA: alpha-L-arabinofuranosidase C-terminal domain-containing protein [Bryobacteraceae bacterium]|nr:alpha-L-arabinofuranosidase C-terminal domain-containing protein [Bryobacteraceae bacterium]
MTPQSLQRRGSQGIGRRQLIAAAGWPLFHAITSRKGLAAEGRTRKLVVHADSEIAAIRPALHGHFAEHLGSCIYGGLWVGRDSKIPNIRGHRKQAVEYLRQLGIPVLRWPGGCFADDYHWRDGIGPAEKRPRRVNLWWGQYTEDNSYGTHEFIDFCRLIEAEPYLAGNVGSGTPQELRDWMEYCNYPDGSTLSGERAANGSREPFRVRYWGVGNENWGCGGRMTADEYATHYRRFANYLTPEGGIGGTKVFLIACGPNRNDTEWSRRFLSSMNRSLAMVHGFAMHFYSSGKSAATKFTNETAREQLSSFADLEKAVVQQHALLRSFDPVGNIGLMVDEWGVWDRIEAADEKRYGKLWQQITMRSAVAAGLGLNVFHRQADKLIMCNIAQIANVLHSLLLTDEDRCIRTSTYYAFELTKPHRGATAVRVENGDDDPLGISISASRAGGQVVVTTVNPKIDEPARVECVLPGRGVKSVSARLLHHADMNACNTFENPDTIVPRMHQVETTKAGLRFEMPPLSVVTAVIQLA